MTMRLMPPNNGLSVNTITVNGRTYSAAPGVTLDVNDWDGGVIAANGWIVMAASAGATASRPTNPVKNQQFHDSTLNITIIYDGKVWRNPATGGAV